LANTRIYIFDRHRQPVPVGVTGEIYIGGVGVARGYLHRPELTAERFIADPFSDEPDARLYRTGDLGRWREDGVIDYLGRNDFQVKLRGLRIELGEIEAQLVRLPGVRQAAVLARESSAGDKRLVAYLVGENKPGQNQPGQNEAEESEQLSPSTLRSALGTVLPDYMIPSAFVVLDRLPLTPNGKLDRNALPTPADEAYAQRVYEAPIGSLEKTVAELWSALLQHDRISRHDHFFALGGHSLLAVQLIAQLRQRLGVDIPLADVFAQPVLHDFAGVVADADCSEVAAIPFADRDQLLPLSWAQQRLWFIAQLDAKASTAYHIPGGLRLRGSLDRHALRAALDRIVERHEVLRTRFQVIDGQPRQQIDPPAGIALAEYHLENPLLDHHDADSLDTVLGEYTVIRKNFLAEHTQAEVIAPFDLYQGPLIRGRLLQLGTDDHVLLLTLHHLIADGWSMGVFTAELSALYNAFSQRQPDPLSALPIQYADYSVWQQQWLQGPLLQPQLQYWAEHLRGAPDHHQLPSDRPRPAVQDYCGARIDVTFDAELTQQLKALGHRHGTTLYMTVLAGWAATVARLSGQDDLVIGSPVAGRTRTELNDLIGLFVNTQALRIDLSQNPSVSELLAQIRHTALAAQHHQDIPFEQVVEALNPIRSLAHSPIFQLMFAWQNTPTRNLALGDLQVTPHNPSHCSAPFDLTLDLSEQGETIAGSLTYAAALYDATTIERHWQRLERMLRAMVANADTRIADIDFLQPSERQRVLIDFNDTEQCAAGHGFIHEQIEAQARLEPNSVAVICGDSQLAVAELNARANRLARHLRELGIAPERRVVLCLRPGVDFVVALLAVHKAGGAYVPVDSDYPPERLGFMLHDSAPTVVITSADVSAVAQMQIAVAAAQAHASQPLAVLDMCTDTARWAAQSHSDLGDVGLTPANLAYVIYTSGSTGRPKAAQVQHGGLCNLLDWYVNDVGLRAVHRVLVASSTSFDLTQKNLLAPLMVGAPIYFSGGYGGQASSDDVFRPRVLLDLIEQQGIDWLNLAPSAFYALIEADRGRIPSSLRGLHSVILGGEPIRIDRLQRLPSPRPRIVNSYGPTECSDVVAWHVLDDDWSRYRDGVPLGRPIRNTRLYVLNASNQPVAIGSVGELCIAGAGVGRGYLHQPAQTDARFVPDPFQRGEMLYRTGDLARWTENGELKYLGRNDFQIKIRGLRIELGDIEAQLLRLPGVRAAAVIARDDATDDKQLVAYIVTDSDDGATHIDWRNALSVTLPPHMIPAAIVQLPALPLTPNGKLDRNALPAPGEDAFTRTDYEPPEGPVETLLVELWGELLPCARIGRHDNFFALGGHSLLAVTLLERMHECGLAVDVRTLFECGSLKELAAAVREHTEDTGDIAIPVNLIPAEPDRRGALDLDDEFEEFRL
jgi:amino acid adenylation domain-containing protein